MEFLYAKMFVLRLMEIKKVCQLKPTSLSEVNFDRFSMENHKLFFDRQTSLQS